MANRTTGIFCPKCYEAATRILAIDPGEDWALAVAPAPGVKAPWHVRSGKWTLPETHPQPMSGEDSPFKEVSRLFMVPAFCIGDDWVVQPWDVVPVVIEGVYQRPMGRQQAATLNRRIGELRGFLRGFPQFHCRAIFDPIKSGGEAIRWKRDMGVEGLSERARKDYVQATLGLDVANEHEADAVVMAAWARDNIAHVRRVGLRRRLPRQKRRKR